MSAPNRKPPDPAPTLHVLRGEQAGQSFEIRGDVTLIGRANSCDIVLGRKSVSRHHARIILEGGGFFLEDLGSRSGTLVNGIPVSGRVPLRDGSQIRISKTLFAFHHPLFRVDDEDTSSRILGVRDVPGSGEPRGPAVGPEERLRHVLEISRNLGDTLHLDAVLQKTLEALFQIFPQAERGFVVLKEGDEMDEAPRASRFRGETQGGLAISRTVFNHLMQKGQAILSTDLPNDTRFNEADSVASSPFRTMMCAPLLDRERQFAGILQIDARHDRGRFSEGDLDLLAAVAVLVAVAVENARLHAALINQTQTMQEEADAREVQMALLPSRRPELPGYAFWDFYEPARSVGGDYFDYLPIALPHGRPARWAIAVGDVVGKGMSAALLMARLSAEVRVHILSGLDPGEALARLNDNFAHSRIENRFITFLLVLLDGESHRLTVVSAGHMGPIIHRASGAVEVIGEDVAGPPLGIDPGLTFRASETALGPGDRVVLYTDGVHEAIDAAIECFGFPRLRQVIVDSPGPVDFLGESIIGAVRRHVGDHPQSDDITLLCFGRL